MRHVHGDNRAVSRQLGQDRIGGQCEPQACEVGGITDINGLVALRGEHVDWLRPVRVYPYLRTAARSTAVRVTTSPPLSRLMAC